MKITREEFDRIFADVVSDEMSAFVAEMKNPAGAMLIGMICASVNAKITDRLFNEDNELEIVKE